VLAGPAGSGKGHFGQLLRESGDLPYGLTRSHTTRARLARDHDDSYFWVSEGEMDELIAKGEMLECKTIHGNRYGTSVAEIHRVVDEGKVPLLDIDIQGVREIGSRLAQEGQGRLVFCAFMAITTTLCRTAQIERHRKSLKGADGPAEPADLEARLLTAAWELEEAGRMAREDPTATGFVVERFVNQIRTPERTAELLDRLQEFYRKAGR